MSASMLADKSLSMTPLQESLQEIELAAAGRPGSSKHLPASATRKKRLEFASKARRVVRFASSAKETKKAKQQGRPTLRPPSPFLFRKTLYPGLAKKLRGPDVQELDVLKLAKKFQVPTGIIRVELKKLDADCHARFPLVAKAQAKALFNRLASM
jgi:hypothetical protein